MINLAVSAIAVIYFGMMEYAFRHFSVSKLERLAIKRGITEKGEEFANHILHREDHYQYSVYLYHILALSLFAANLHSKALWLYVVSFFGILYIIKAFLRPIVRHYSEGIVLFYISYARVLMWITYPITFFVVLLDERILPSKEDDETEAENAILSMVEDSELEGNIEESEREMIRGIFDLDETQVGEVMTPRTNIRGIDIHSTMEEARAFVLEHGHSRIPVYEDDMDNIVGVLYGKDLLLHLHKGSNATIAEIMRKPFFMPESKRIAELLEHFRKEKTHLGIVLDEYGGTAGLITIEDILEEIVGEIQDEYDKNDESGLITRIGPNLYEVAAEASINDVNKSLNIEIDEDGEYETIAGFVTTKMEKIPRPGDSFEFAGVSYLVLKASERKIERLRIEIITNHEKVNN